MIITLMANTKTSHAKETRISCLHSCNLLCYYFCKINERKRNRAIFFVYYKTHNITVELLVLFFQTEYAWNGKCTTKTATIFCQSQNTKCNSIVVIMKWKLKTGR